MNEYQNTLCERSETPKSTYYMMPFHYRKYKLIEMMKSNSELHWPQSWGGSAWGHGYAPYLDCGGGFIDLCHNL